MADLDPRRAEPGTVFTYTTTGGRQRHLRTDDEGVVQPRDTEDEEVLKRFGTTVHQPAREARRAEAEKAQRQKARAKEGGSDGSE